MNTSNLLKAAAAAVVLTLTEAPQAEAQLPTNPLNVALGSKSTRDKHTSSADPYHSSLFLLKLKYEELVRSGIPLRGDLEVARFRKELEEYAVKAYVLPDRDELHARIDARSKELGWYAAYPEMRKVAVTSIPSLRPSSMEAARQLLARADQAYERGNPHELTVAAERLSEMMEFDYLPLVYAGTAVAALLIRARSITRRTESSE